MAIRFSIALVNAYDPTTLIESWKPEMPARLSRLSKPVSLTLIAGLISACGGEEVDIRQIHTIQGLYYKVNDKVPFTGTVTNMPVLDSPMSYASCNTQIKEGVRDGLETCHYSDGNKYSETEYVKGNKHGNEKRWLADGFLYTDFHWVDGKADGLNKLWNIKKQPVSEIEVRDGQKVGIEKLWRDGVLEYDTVWANGTRSGRYFYNGYYSVITNGSRGPLLKEGTNEPYVEAVEPVRAVATEAKVSPEECLAAQIKAIHDEAEESGEEVAISQDMLKELKSECGA